ncbi:MAG: LuxR C-terminal-related transcriptional regulator [Candidatus Acidiferrum sp.]
MLALALRSSTAAVAVFDESFRCTAVNSALFSVSRIPPQACLGKTLPQLLGGRPGQVHRAFKFVRDTGATLRHVPLSPLAPNQAAARHWIADFFPLRDPSRGIHWIGTTLSEAPRKTHLRQKLYHVSGRNLSTDPTTAEFHAAPTEEIAETCEPVLRRSLDLLDRSMALRRQISEMRLAASLHRRSRPVIWVKPIGPYLQVASVSLETSEQNLAAKESSSDEKFSADLSARELQVVRLLAEGNSNKQIALTLDLSTRTIETYRARLMIKLDLHSLGELIRYAVRHLLIQA